MDAIAFLDPAAWVAGAPPFQAFRVRLMLVRDGCPRTYPAFTSSAAVHEMFRSLGSLDRELFLSLLLDTKQRLTGVSLVSVGTLDASLVHPREVYKPAIVGNAAAVICVHNHPSGDPNPSKEDHEITRRLAEAGRVLGIPLLDHLVIGADGYASFKDRGWV
jgi:DNA repair protein RadC